MTFDEVKTADRFRCCAWPEGRVCERMVGGRTYNPEIDAIEDTGERPVVFVVREPGKPATFHPEGKIPAHWLLANWEEVVARSAAMLIR